MASRHLKIKSPQLFPYQIYLITKDAKQFEDAIKKTLGKRKLGRWVNGTVDLGVPWRFYFATSASAKTYWARVVESELGINHLDTGTRAHSGALFLLINKRIFAITFGYGRSLLDSEFVEQDLGVEACQKLLNPDGVLSVERTVLSGAIRKESTQMVRPTSSNHFEIDTTQAIIRGMTGTLKDDVLGKQLSGNVAATLISELNFKNLPNICRHLLEAYYGDSKGIWRSYYDFVRDKKLIDDLYGNLVERLRQQSYDGIWIAPPDNVDYSTITNLKFSNQRDNFEIWSLKISNFVSGLSRPDQLGLSTLRSHSVQACVDGAEDPSRSWPLLKCVTFECEMGHHRYILHGQKWFRVAKTLAEEVDQFIDGLEAGPALPKAHHGEDEANYNSRVAHETGFNLMDRRLVQYGGTYSKIEIADLFSDSKELFHIKKWGGSEQLSHLFDQGKISIEALMRDSSVREKARLRLQESGCLQRVVRRLIPENFEPRDFKVIYGIIGARDGTWSDVLPFFAKLSLRVAATWLKERQIRIQIVRIGVDQLTDRPRVRTRVA